MTPSNSAVRFSTLCLLLASTPCVVACGGSSGAGAKSPSNEHSMVGAPAPDFDLPAQYGGARASLREARGKVAIVDFWATWCEPCRASFPKYEALLRKHDGDIVVIGISVDDEPEGIDAFAKETGASFTLAWDEDKAVAGAYEPEAMPTSFIVDQKGVVRYVHEGFHSGDDAEIEKQVERLLNK